MSSRGGSLSPGVQDINRCEDRCRTDRSTQQRADEGDGSIFRAVLYANVVFIFFIISFCLIRRATREQRRDEAGAEEQEAATAKDRATKKEKLASKLQSYFDTNKIQKVLESTDFESPEDPKEFNSESVIHETAKQSEPIDSREQQGHVQVSKTELNQAQSTLVLSDNEVTVDEDDLNDIELGETTSRVRLSDQHPTVPNVCAICIETYQVGDVVAWSSNPECSHAFHCECIVSYLAFRGSRGEKKQDDGKSNVEHGRACPCCRQPFVTEIGE